MNIVSRFSNRLEAWRQSKRIRGVLQRSHSIEAAKAWKHFELLSVVTVDGVYRFNTYERDWILMNLDPHRSMRSGVCSCGASAADLAEFGHYPCINLVRYITQHDFDDIRNGGVELMAKTEGEVLLRFV